MSDTWINVKAAPYSAAGNGTGDDTAAIQAAIDAAVLSVTSDPFMNGSATTKAGHATVWFPQGVYPISAQLSVSLGDTTGGDHIHGVSLVGEGGYYGSMLIWKTGVPAPAKGMIYLHGDAAQIDLNNRIADLTLYGNAIASNGIWMADVSGSTIERCVFKEFAAGTNGACVYMSVGTNGCLLNTIDGCRFDGRNNWGVFQEDDDVPGGGPGGSFMNGTRILNNEFAGTLAGSLRLNGDHGYTGTILVEGNYFEGIGPSVQPTESISCGTNTRIANNWFEDLTGSQPDNRNIVVRAGCFGVEITGNTFGITTGARGIELPQGNEAIDIHDNFWINNHTISNIYLPGTGYRDIRIHSNGERNPGENLSAGFVEITNFAERAQVHIGFTGTFPYGYEKLAINATAPEADLDVYGQAFTDGVSTFVKPGVPNDDDFIYIEDGMVAIDSANNRLYVRIAGIWQYVQLSGGPGAMAWFMPPATHQKVPPWERNVQQAIGRRSPAYRMFMRTYQGEDIVIGEVVYKGGRWNGPLSDAEIEALQAAGYGDRVYYATDPYQPDVVLNP